MNAQQLEQHFDQVDPSTMKPGGALHFTAAEVKADPGTVIQKICGIYKIVKPFLEWAERFFLIPKKVKEVIRQFTDLMDTVCP